MDFFIVNNHLEYEILQNLVKKARQLEKLLIFI